MQSGFIKQNNMKKIKKFYSVSILFLTALSFEGCYKCQEEACTPVYSYGNHNENLVDSNVSSAFYNQSVANFQFTQTITTYNTPNECTTCPAISASTALQISNLTEKTINFDYTINFDLNAAHWEHIGGNTIAPSGSIIVGQVDTTNTAIISQGNFTIQFTRIIYY